MICSEENVKQIIDIIVGCKGPSGYEIISSTKLNTSYVSCDIKFCYAAVDFASYKKKGLRNNY